MALLINLLITLNILYVKFQRTSVMLRYDYRKLFDINIKILQ